MPNSPVARDQEQFCACPKRTHSEARTLHMDCSLVGGSLTNMDKRSPRVGDIQQRVACKSQPAHRSMCASSLFLQAMCSWSSLPLGAVGPCCGSEAHQRCTIMKSSN
jgi:hypothetical protein